jgi:hypothetical protein
MAYAVDDDQVGEKRYGKIIGCRVDGATWIGARRVSFSGHAVAFGRIVR